MRRLIVSITSGKRECKEDVTEETKEHFDECVSNGVNPHLVKLGWDEWIREVIIKHRDIDQLNGKHFLYGWVESFLQSDDVPAWVWDAKDLVIEFYAHEDGEKK